ncbi:dTDP-4-amino-4,6-dideoxygalactose transaminase [Calditrichota bacterium]
METLPLPQTTVKTRIPFNKPYIVGRELEYISEAVHNGHLAGNGDFSKMCCDWMENHFSAEKVILTHSCTTALEISALLADINPWDEVIMPSFTFVSTANAFALRGARIKFVDIRPDTLNLDENLLEASITEMARAIVPVHYGGVSCEMDTIQDIARRNNLVVIEDAAQGVNATYKDQYLGTLGTFGAFSFHETKNFICGEGGALLINDEEYIDRAEVLTEKGTDRSKFFRGEVDKYSWVDVGSSSQPSEIVAAFLFAQLENADWITHKRRTIFDLYQKMLSPLQEAGLVRLPYCPDDCSHNAHMFYLILNDNHTRDDLLAYLKTVGINAVFHFVPLHSSPMGVRMGNAPGTLPVTEDLSERLLRLPCYYDLSEEAQLRIIEEVFRYFS